MFKIIKNIEKSLKSNNELLLDNLKEIEKYMIKIDNNLDYMQEIIEKYGCELDNHEVRITNLERKVK